MCAVPVPAAWTAIWTMGAPGALAIVNGWGAFIAHGNAEFDELAGLVLERPVRRDREHRDALAESLDAHHGAADRVDLQPGDDQAFGEWVRPGQTDPGVDHQEDRGVHQAAAVNDAMDHRNHEEESQHGVDAAPTVEAATGKPPERPAPGSHP